MFKLNLLRWSALLTLLSLTGVAHAHGAHGSVTFMDGLTHPFTGMDHVLAMVAVGAWSALVLPQGRRLAGPWAFLVMLLMGMGVAGLGQTGTVNNAYVEVGVAVSVILLGLMLVAGQRLSKWAGVTVIALAGLAHGWVHGVELTGGAAIGALAAGLFVGSACLHAVGLKLGEQFLRLPAWTLRLCAAVLSLSGVVLLSTRL